MKSIPPQVPLLYRKTGMQGYTYFSYFDQNIDCGYSLEPPQFLQLKITLYITWECFRNVCLSHRTF